MLNANETRDKYNLRQRGTDLEGICKLMDENGITLQQLEEYIDNRPPSTVLQVQAHRKKLATSRAFTYGRTIAKQPRKPT